MNSGYKMSHDNEKRNPKTGLKEYYADKGRFGDDRIGIVDNEPAHINAWEEYLLEAHGEIGEEIVKTIGSGATNPETGMKEYAWYNDAWNAVADFTEDAWEYVAGEGSAGDWLYGENSWLGSSGPILGDTPVWRPAQGSWGIFGQTQDSWEYEQQYGTLDPDAPTTQAVGDITAKTINTLQSDLERSIGPEGSIAKSAGLDRQLISMKGSDQLADFREQRDQKKAASGFARTGKQQDFDFTESQVAMQKSYMGEAEEKADLVSGIQKELNQIVMGYQEATGNVYSSTNLDDLQERLNELT